MTATEGDASADDTADPDPEADRGVGEPGLAGQVDAARFLAVSDGLKQAFARLAGADLPVDAKGRWQRRLIAITNAAKRDLPRAQEQLVRFDQDWRREVG